MYSMYLDCIPAHPFQLFPELTQYISFPSLCHALKNVQFLSHSDPVSVVHMSMAVGS